MTDLGQLLGLPPPQRRIRARTRCRACHRPVYVDQLVAGLGHCCAAKAGLIVHRYRLAARPQNGPTLLDHLPEDTVEPYPQVRVDVTGLDPADAHRKIVEHARSMVSPPGSAFPAEVLDAANDQWAGIVAILERHAPLDLAANGIRCSHCSADQAPAGWPCDDYRDACRGLATGLPTRAAGR